jgi:hypothetical protein
MVGRKGMGCRAAVAVAVEMLKAVAAVAAAIAGQRV